MSKKRYQVTLTPENVERYQAACRQLKLPVSTMSAFCDEAIKQQAIYFEKVISRGTTSIKDLFDMIGDNLSDVYEDKMTGDSVKPKQN